MPSPPIWRVLAAFAIAPAVAAFALACYESLYAGIHDNFTQTYNTFVFLVIGGYLPTFLFGLPAYAVLKNWVRPTPLNCVIAGAIVASMPWLLVGLQMLIPPPGSSAMGGQHVTEPNCHVTLWGLFEFVKMVGPTAILGGFAGGVFWMVAVAGVKRPAMTSTDGNLTPI